MKAAIITLGVSAALMACGGGNKSSSSPGAYESGGDESGGGVPNSRVEKMGSGSVSAVIGPPGGALELSKGPRVEIPPGAVQGATEFVLTEAQKSTAFYNKEHERPIGPIFVFSPGLDAPEGRSVRVSLPVPSLPDGWGEPSIAYEYETGEMVGAEDAIHTQWDYERASYSGGRIVAELPGLNGNRLQFVLTNLEAQ